MDRKKLYSLSCWVIILGTTLNGIFTVLSVSFNTSRFFLASIMLTGIVIFFGCLAMALGSEVIVSD